MPVPATETGNLYEIILRVASFPVLLLLIALAWLITNYLMNPRWKQERRNRQIRKAVAARQSLRAESTVATAAENNASSPVSIIEKPIQETIIKEKVVSEQTELPLAELKNQH